MGRSKPEDLTTPSESTGSWASDIEDSLRREDRAVSLYRSFAQRATTPRVKEVFEAIMAVETDHIALDEIAEGYL